MQVLEVKILCNTYDLIAIGLTLPVNQRKFPDRILCRCKPWALQR